MNTVFVVIMWLSLYFLFFHPLSEQEFYQKTMDFIYREFFDGYYGGGV